jgi:ABC-type multidrug transport system fused ATPase/permease subunit
LGGFAVVCVLLKGIVLAYGSLNAAEAFHERVLKTVLYAPMSFFDTTPIGRILNRFSKDQVENSFFFFSFFHNPSQVDS